jgi:hypothetical protein
MTRRASLATQRFETAAAEPTASQLDRPVPLMEPTRKGPELCGIHRNFDDGQQIYDQLPKIEAAPGGVH